VLFGRLVFSLMLLMRMVKAKCRLFIAAVEFVVVGGDDVCSFWGWKEERATARANADPCGMTNKRTYNDKGEGEIQGSLRCGGRVRRLRSR
jgi:hypothetical protein